MTGKPGGGNRTNRRGSPPIQRVVISLSLAKRLRAIAPDTALEALVEDLVASWVDEQEQARHERLLNDLEVFMSMHGVGTPGYLNGGPSVWAVMGELDLDREESIALLQELGQRLKEKQRQQ